MTRLRGIVVLAEDTLEVVVQQTGLFWQQLPSNPSAGQTPEERVSFFRSRVDGFDCFHRWRFKPSHPPLTS